MAVLLVAALDSAQTDAPRLQRKISLTEELGALQRCYCRELSICDTSIFCCTPNSTSAVALQRRTSLMCGCSGRVSC